MENWTKDDWDKFEKLVAVCQEFFTQAEAEVRHNVKLTGASDVPRQIDVLIEPMGLYSAPVIISCKFEKDPVGIAHASDWSGIANDVGASKGVIVSKTGFSPDAITFAKDPRNRLELWQIRELNEQDFDGYIQKITVDCTMWVPWVPEDKVEFKVGTDDPALYKTLNTQGIPFKFSAQNRDSMYLRDDQGNLCENIWDKFVEFYYSNASIDKHKHTFDFQPSEHRYIVTQGMTLQFRRFYCEIHEYPHKFQVHFDALDHFNLQYENAITGETKLIPIEFVQYVEHQD